MRRQRGFTLMEAIIVIALTGIVGAMVAVFVRQPVDAYADASRRAEMSDEADTALRRLAREVQGALPNSVRVDASGQYLEFIPVRSAGRYRAAPSSTGGGDALDFSSASDASFDVLGPPASAQPGDQLVIHNLGLPGADAYAGSSRRALTTSGSALGSISYALGGSQFPYASPNMRFHIVGTPVSYVCTPVAGGAGSLRRYAGYPIQAAQPVNAAAAPLAALGGAGNALLAGSVSACSFTYNTSASAHKAVLTLRLTLTRSGESVSLLQQVFVENSP